VSLSFTEPHGHAAPFKPRGTIMTTENKTRTITLSGRPPVKIKEDDWPVIAHGSWSDHDNQYEFQANRKWNLDIRVRQHEDGRAIVYGIYSHETHFQNESDAYYKEGVLLDADAEDIAGAIDRVGDLLMLRGVEAEHVKDVVAETISELPAEEI
jgi:hypothetical protein